MDGTIYLKSDNSLKKILYDHEFEDGSSVFVVDQSGTIIYHPDQNRVNESIGDHPIVQNLMQGKSGESQVINRIDTSIFLVTLTWITLAGGSLFRRLQLL